MQRVWLTRIAGVLSKTMQFTSWNLLKTPTDSQYITFTVHRNQSNPQINDNTFKKMVVENSCWTVLSSFPIVVVGLRHLAFNDSLSNSVSVRKSVSIRVQRFMHLSHMYDNVLVPYVYQFIHRKKSNYSVILKWWCVSHFLHDLRSIPYFGTCFSKWTLHQIVPTEAIWL